MMSPYEWPFVCTDSWEGEGSIPVSPEILDALNNIGVFHIPLEVTLISEFG